MDEFLEQMLSASSWGDGTGRTSWDSSVGHGDASESSCVPQSIARFSSVSMASLGPMGAMLPTQALDSHNGTIHGSVAGTCLESKNAQYELQDTVFLPPTGLQTHTPLNRLAEAGTVAGGSMVLQLNTTSPIGKTLQNLPSIGGGGLPRGLAPLDTSSLSGHNAFGGSDFQQQPSWHQPYIEGVPPLQTTLGQGKQEMFVLNGEPLLNDTHLGKRSRNDEEMRNKNQQEAMSHVAQSLGLQSGKIEYGDQMGVGQNEGTAAVANGSHGRLRVRARRGQATDPHSIAERNRRERIAERMKALQELVPDSNKTDKASMLDEIINYVKFLQMQVKCLSLCRLGGGGAAAPLLNDFQKEGSAFLRDGQANGGCQDGMAYAERQVARLMDEDMSAAMQYLQSKGLCLMPISLATAISSTGVRQQSGNAAMKSLELNASVSEKQQPADQSQFATGGSSDGEASGSDSASKLHGTLSLRKPFKGIAKDESADEKVDSMTSL